jgi:hypothetical protein
MGSMRQLDLQRLMEVFLVIILVITESRMNV